MGYIYKITCNITKKIYVGQTVTNIEQRWKDHVRVSKSPSHGDYNFPFHRAIRKYGAENFTIECIEECPNDKLNEREIYWIDKLNSYKDGYNASLGGFGHTKYDHKAIVEYYLTHDYNLFATCAYFGVYDQVVYTALKGANIDYKNLKKQNQNQGKTNNKKKYNKILLVEKNITFNSCAEMNEYFGKRVDPNVYRCLRGQTEKAYGYHWKGIE